MNKWKCKICGWIYDPKKGFITKNIAPNTDFSKVPDSFRCPMCGAVKKWFFELKE